MLLNLKRQAAKFRSVCDQAFKNLLSDKRLHVTSIRNDRWLLYPRYDLACVFGDEVLFWGDVVTWKSYLRRRVVEEEGIGT